jgi:hypothetical protein
MSQKEELHLNEQQIIQAVVDVTDLPFSLQDHLNTCPMCLAQKERFSGLLSQLGHKSKVLSPTYRKRVTLTETNGTKRPWLWAWNWQRLLVAGLSCAMVLAVLWWASPFKIPPEWQESKAYHEMWEDYRMMAEIVWLEEHALPQVYFDISGESAPLISEEFIQFLIPHIQNDAFHQFKTKEVQYVV